MDRTQFTCIEPIWWLSGAGLELNTVEIRKVVGTHLGWEAESQWYLEKKRSS